MVSDVESLKNRAEGAKSAATEANRAALDLARARTVGGEVSGQALACVGETCIRPSEAAGTLGICPRWGGACMPLAVSPSCPGGLVWAGSGCVEEGARCDAPHADASNLEFAYDSSGRCMATTDCKTGFAKHPADQRCARDCGNGLIFSHVMDACVSPGALCPTQDSPAGLLRAFDEMGNCSDTESCAPGKAPHPVDRARCVDECAVGTAYSAAAEACVSEGDPCPGGGQDSGGVCRRDGDACRSTVRPDRRNPTLVTAPVTPEELGGARMEYAGGRCYPTGACDDPEAEYDWEEGGCRRKNPAIQCPPGFSKVSDAECTMSRGVGEGRGGVSISGIDPEHRVRSTYAFRKSPRYKDGDYNVSGPGISGGARGIRGGHSTEGGWVTGRTAYDYSWRNNDGTASFTWRVQK